MRSKFTHTILGGVVVTIAALSLQSANAANGNWLDPDVARKEDPDFSIQGEYVGEIKGGAKLAAQVIALGDGHFQAVVYPGGLPGAGWDETNKILMDGKRDGKATTFKPIGTNKRYLDGNPEKFSATKKNPPVGHKPYNATITGDAMVGKTDGGKTFTLKRTIRTSSTLGAKPPKGAIVLFGGKPTDQFKPCTIVDGNLMCGTNTTQRFQSYTLHLEYRCTYKPKARSQGRSNSGVYHQARYETQVLDSFGLEGLMNEAGGIYSIAKSRINMSLPPLTWNTYDVEFITAQYDGDRKTKDAVITVKLNGVLIHENQKLGHRTTASPMKEGPEPGFIHLQAHGNKTVFKNIWIIKN
jgi:hypothetical protein